MASIVKQLPDDVVDAFRQTSELVLPGVLNDAPKIVDGDAESQPRSFSFLNTMGVRMAKNAAEPGDVEPSREENTRFIKDVMELIMDRLGDEIGTNYPELSAAVATSFKVDMLDLPQTISTTLGVYRMNDLTVDLTPKRGLSFVEQYRHSVDPTLVETLVGLLDNTHCANGAQCVYTDLFPDVEISAGPICYGAYVSHLLTTGLQTVSSDDIREEIIQSLIEVVSDGQNTRFKLLADRPPWCICCLVMANHERYFDKNGSLSRSDYATDLIVLDTEACQGCIHFNKPSFLSTSVELCGGARVNVPLDIFMHYKITFDKQLGTYVVTKSV